MRSIPPVLVLCCALVPGPATRAEVPVATREDLAGHWAPVVRQDTAHPSADFITRFDYDGNQDGDDNWENLDHHPLEAWVYWAAVETATHWYLTYALFHPRDYDRIDNPITSHENDLEGILLMVEKDGTPHGRLVLMETVAHFDFYQYSDDPGVTCGTEDVDGTIRREGHRPVVEVEARGHGIKAWHGREFPGGDGVVYRFGGTARVPSGRNDRDVSYDLLPIADTLWAHRYDVGPGRMFAKTAVFPSGTFGVAFNGTTHGNHKANAPWGWDDHNDGDVARGDIFLNPASMVTRHLSFDRPVSLEYLHNPFLTGEAQAMAGARGGIRQTLFAQLHGE